MAKQPESSIPKLRGELDYMMQVSHGSVNPFDIHEWVVKNKILKGNKDTRAIRWQAIRTYMVEAYGVEFPIETQRYSDLQDLLKEMKEKEESNV